MFLDFDTLIKLPGISKDNQFIEKLRAQCDLGKKMFAADSNSIEAYLSIKSMGASFLQLEEVYRRILVIPILSATAERSFSTMRRIKTYNRSTMTGKRLHNLALLSIEREKSEELIQNPDEILNEFARCTNALTMDIVDNNVPVVSRPYKASAAEREIIDKIVNEWKAAGLVAEKKSAYASPVLFVRKKNGEPRLVVDYRKLNSQTIRKVFPTPNMNDHLEALCDAKLFCTLDLDSGYLQVPLMEEAKAKTSFTTPSETGQFERMVFGLVNAPYKFSRLMQEVMQHLQRKVAMWYLDNILIPAKDFKDMIN
ncbi:hypothetical protein QTP88_029469 [Uroleucon formosanum]